MRRGGSVVALAYDPDERIHPPEAFNWGNPPPLPALLCECLLCAPPCNKPPSLGARWCMPCFQGFHRWAEAPCGSPFHYDRLDPEGCPCMADADTEGVN